MKLTLKDYKRITKDVIEDAIKEKKKLNECIREQISSEWTEDQVKRLIEIVNKSTYNSYYDKLEDKRFSFELADFAEIRKGKSLKKAEQIIDETFLDFLSDGMEIPILIEKAASHRLADEIVQCSIDNEGFFSFMERDEELDYGYESVKVAKKLDEEFLKLSSEILSKINSNKKFNKAVTADSEKLFKKKIAFKILEKCANDAYAVINGVGEGMRAYPHAKELYNTLKEVKKSQTGGELLKKQLKDGLGVLNAKQF